MQFALLAQSPTLGGDGGLRAWHVGAGVAAVLVTLVAIAEVFFAGLSCHYRG